MAHVGGTTVEVPQWHVLFAHLLCGVHATARALRHLRVESV
ncbi:hypothetical protein [Streptomyces canus]